MTQYDAHISTHDPAPAADDAFDLAAHFDVPRLLGASRPQIGRGVLFLPTLGLIGLVGALLVTLLGPGGLFGTALALTLLGASLFATIYLTRLAAGAKAERREVRRAEELVTLRHWPQAADELIRLLSRPMRMNPNRRPALVALCRVLGRYGLHDEAVEVAEAAIADRGTDPATRFGVGCGRAMLLLQAGRLGDANDAIGRLRGEVRSVDTAVRRANRARAEAEEQGDPPPAEEVPDPASLPEEALLDDDTTPATAAAPQTEGFDPAPLAVVELYRDVQTRHSDEAVEMFESRRDDLREQLGLRFGDALALAAVAAGRLGRTGEAARLWADATALVPAGELLRRYPETAEIEHPATPWPTLYKEAA